jgi:hypothetical protein
MNFFKSDPTARPWFLMKPGAEPDKDTKKPNIE